MNGFPRSTLTLALASGALVASCGSKPVAQPPAQTQTALTYYKDVQPIITANCAGCHDANGIGPFDLTTYDGVKANGALIAPAVSAHVMPPWMPGNDSPAMVGQRGLTDAEIKTITDWVNQGMAEGNPADAQSVKPPTSSFQASASMQATMPYAPNPSLGTDDYHCFVLDPKLTADTAVTAFNILPGDRRVVHHVIIYAFPPSQETQLKQLQNSGDGSGYTCFGGSGDDQAAMVGGWVPGTLATTFPDGTGVVIPAGSKLVMQVHYNMLTVQKTTDQTTVQLQYAPASSVNAAYIFPVVNSDFSIPPGAVQTVTQQWDTTSSGFPDGITVKIWGVLPHMHLHGTDIKVSGTKAGGTTETFIHIPKWQFQWQQMYFFKTPLTFVKGDSATLSCTFDNTAANQPVINGKQETPRTLTWGEDTLSEMCVNFFYATIE